ncbi:hypothetical protein SB816_20795 [Achromobacter sp. SIMBA_011]|uniref:hypothetical protein n=1 Tax=Achromobacter sp. SIMBA_011 TaxID=3085759 RepID=UPI00397C5235
MNPFETDDVQRYAIRDDHDYKPIADLRHGARVLLEDARQHPEGSHYKWMSAVVLLASTVEAFCQTLGPEVLKEMWDTGRNPIEKKAGPLKKLELIAKRAKVFKGHEDPRWQLLSEVFDARNGFAHPKPATMRSVCIVECRYDELNLRSAEAIRNFRFPLLNPTRLDEVAAAVDAVLLEIWLALGKRQHDLYMQGISIGSWSLAE